MKYSSYAYVMLAVLAISQPVRAEDPEISNRQRDGVQGPQTMLTSMSAYRDQLADAGVEFSLTYDGDLASVADGGRKRLVTYLDFIEFRTTFDNEKLFGLKGNTVSFSLIDSNGTTTNGSTVGSTQGTNNSEVGPGGNGVRLYEAWVQQNFLDDRVSVLLGVHDLNTEFVATTVSDNFITPTFQIGQTFAQSGENGPSVFPNTALAARLKVKPTEDSYAAFAVYDGVAGAPATDKGTGIRLKKKDGVLLVGELAYVPPAADSDAELNKLAVGVWNYTSGLDDLNEVDSNGNPAKSNSQGIYFLSSARIYHDKAAGRDVSAFARLGFADESTVQVDWDYSAGIVATGFVPTRPEGEFGLGVSGAHNGDAYVQSVVAAGGATARNETIYELYYRDTLFEGVSLQPSVQYVTNPGTDTVTDDALIFGTRLSVSF